MRILFTGNLFHHYEDDLRDGLLELGHEVDMRFNNIFGPFQPQDIRTIPEWLAYGVLPHKLKIDYFTRRSVERYNADVLSLIRRNRYDLMIVVNARNIREDVLDAFKGPKALWFMDGLPRYMYVAPRFPHFDYRFMFEPTDVPFVKETLGLDSHFLTLAFGPKRYYKKALPPKYDASFVGSWAEKRDEYLDALIGGVTENVCICGDFYRSSFPRVKEKTLKANVPSHVANDLYGSSKVNVNIHIPQSKEGFSVRTFEIIGAGGFEIVERQKARLQYFEEGKHMEFYDSREEFLDKCRYYIAHDAERQRIADAGHKLALEKHTWKARFIEMFQTMNLQSA